jgi:hypothetical protein
MIPDFPQEKEKLMQFWIKYLEVKNREFQGIIGESPFHVNHEGHQWNLNRIDGSKDNQPYHEIQAIFHVQISEVPDLTPDKIRLKLDKIAEEMAQQISKNVFEEIIKATRQAGNEVNAHGQPLSQELILQMFEKIDLDFDKNGNWKPPSIIMHPDMWAAKKDEIKSWETDEGFLTKQREIIARKKEEWRDRENHRKLVD